MDAKLILFVSDLDGSSLSVSNTHNTIQDSNPSLVSSSSQPPSPSEIQSTLLTKKHLIPFSNESGTHSLSLTLTPENSIIDERNFNGARNILNEEVLIPKQVLQHIIILALPILIALQVHAMIRY